MYSTHTEHAGISTQRNINMAYPMWLLWKLVLDTLPHSDGRDSPVMEELPRLDLAFFFLSQHILDIMLVDAEVK